MSASTASTTGTADTQWWLQEPPPPASREDSEYDALCDEPDLDIYSDSDLDYFADRAADEYERWIFREP